MKKITLALPISLSAVGAVAFITASQLVGAQTQNEYEQLLERLNGLGYATFENESYESGLSESTAVTKVQATMPDNTVVPFQLHHEINHLGTPTIITTLHEQEKVIPAELMEMLVEPMPFKLVTEIESDEVVRNTMTISGIDGEEQGTQVKWGGSEFVTLSTPEEIVGSGVLGEFFVTDASAGMTMSFAESTVEYDLQANEFVRLVGTANFVLNQFVLNDPNRPPVEIEKFIVESSSEAADGALNSNVTIDVQGIESIIPLNEALLTFDFNGLSLEGYKTFDELVYPAGQDVEPEEILEAAKQIVQPGSSMSYKLALQNDGGNALADIMLGLKQVGEDGMSEDSLENVVTQRDLLELLNLEGSINADTAALALTPAMMFLGMAGEYITISEESVTSTLSLDGSTLIVNGKELPLETFFGSALDQPIADVLR